MYWTFISGSYFFKGSILEKCGNSLKNGRFSGRIWPDWGNTARADMARLGSIGLNNKNKQTNKKRIYNTSTSEMEHIPSVDLDLGKSRVMSNH